MIILRVKSNSEGLGGIVNVGNINEFIKNESASNYIDVFFYLEKGTKISTNQYAIVYLNVVPIG